MPFLRVILSLIFLSPLVWAAEKENDAHLWGEVNERAVTDALLDASNSLIEITDFSDYLNYPKEQSDARLRESFLIDSLKVLVKFRSKNSNEEFIDWFDRKQFKVIHSSKTTSLEKSQKEKYISVQSKSSPNINAFFSSVVRYIFPINELALLTVMDEREIIQRIKDTFSLINKNNDVKFHPSDHLFFYGLLMEVGSSSMPDSKIHRMYSDCASQLNSFCIYGLARLALADPGARASSDSLFNEGLKFLEKSAFMGNPLAQFDLAQLTYFGSTRILVNEEKAFGLFYLASEYMPTAVWWSGFARARGYLPDYATSRAIQIFKAPETQKEIANLYSNLIIAGDHSPLLLHRVAKELLEISKDVSLATNGKEAQETKNYIENIVKTSQKAINYNAQTDPSSIYTIIEGNYVTHYQDITIESGLHHAKNVAERSPYLIHRHWDVGAIQLALANKASDKNEKFLLLNQALEKNNAAAAKVLAEEFFFDSSGQYYDLDRSFSHYQLAIKNGAAMSTSNYLRSHWALGLHYFSGLGLPGDFGKALQHFNVVIDYGKEDGLSYLPLEYNDRATTIFRQRAMSTDSPAQRIIHRLSHRMLISASARLAIQATAIQKDAPNNKGVNFYLKNACENLDADIFNGQDISEVELWKVLKKFYDNQHYVQNCFDIITKTLVANERLYELGKLYLTGIPDLILPDPSKAYEPLYRGATELNDPSSMYLLGLGYKRELFPPRRELDTAKYWLGQASVRGNADASFELALLSEIPSMYYTRKAIEQGDSVNAPYYLGVMYKEGIGVKPDYPQARAYLEMSFNKKDIRAGVDLALMYSEGLGMPVNLDEAWKICDKIVALGIKIPPLADKKKYIGAMAIAQGLLLDRKSRQAYMKKNPWLGVDMEMTEYVVSGRFKEPLIKLERDILGALKLKYTIRPTSLEAMEVYLLEIEQANEKLLAIADQAIREKFPDKFEDPGAPIKVNLGKFYAFVVGNSKYKHLRPLKTPENDASEISKVLRQDYGFTVETLFDGSRKTILDGLSKYKKILKKNDSFLLYYAGHGEVDKDTATGYWQPIDAQKETQTEWIDVESISKTLKGLPAKNILVVADSCFSGMIFRGLEPAPEVTGNNSPLKIQGYSARLQRAFDIQSRMALTSGGVEPVVDATSKFEKHSMFAKAFLEVLRENPKEVAQATDFASEVTDKVIIVRNANKLTQTPEYGPLPRKYGHKGGDFIFRRTSKSATP